MIQQIEGLGSELDTEALPDTWDRGALHQGQIDILDPLGDD